MLSSGCFLPIAQNQAILRWWVEAFGDYFCTNWDKKEISGKIILTGTY